MAKNTSADLVVGQKFQFAAAKLRNRPDILLALVFLVVLSFLVIAPLVQIIYTSLIYQSNDLRVVRDARVGQFTLYHYARIFSGRLAQSIFYKPFFNSLLVGFGVTLFAMTIGALLAWVLVRTHIHSVDHPLQECLRRARRIRLAIGFPVVRLIQ